MFHGSENSLSLLIFGKIYPDYLSINIIFFIREVESHDYHLNEATTY